MQPLQQTLKTNCGQTCFAMLTGIPYEQVKILYGHENSSCMREARILLADIGYSVGDVIKVDNRKRKLIPIGKRAMIRIKYNNRKHGHFVAMDEEGKIYDPANGLVFDNIDILLQVYNKAWEGVKVLISHYFTLEKL